MYLYYISVRIYITLYSMTSKTSRSCNCCLSLEIKKNSKIYLIRESMHSDSFSEKVLEDVVYFQKCNYLVIFSNVVSYSNPLLHVI